MNVKYEEAARIFKALADENRVKILEILISGETFAGNLLKELDVTQPTLSHHMKILCESGIVVARKDGRWMYYSISEEGRERAFDILSEATVSEDMRRTWFSRKKPQRKTNDIVIL